MDLTRIFDLLVVGGGINGAGIACDAAGRGLGVLLCEAGDIGGRTSSASSKMIHGGLRYLEHYEFRLVRESLAEREVLLAKAPHLIKPLRVLLPHAHTLRPAWMIRLGLFLYDNLSRRVSLPGCQGIDLRRHAAGQVLVPDIRKAFAYSDCMADDSRLVLANAMAARELGAEILPRHRVLHAERRINRWHVTIEDTNSGETMEAVAKVLVNAAGPEVETFLNRATRGADRNHVRLVKGSHIVVPRLYDGPEAFLLQNPDGRVIFVIPFEDRFSLIGTTDVPIDDVADGWRIEGSETEYLCESIGRYFRQPISADDVVWSFAGVRPLYDDGQSDPSDVTRDYVLELEAPETGAPLLSVFGGKLTTYRRLAEAVLDELAPHLTGMGEAWTATKPLPGGDLGAEGIDGLRAELAREYPDMDAAIRDAVAVRHGGLAREVLGDARETADLGRQFGLGLTAREVDYMMAREWAETVDDVIWRRTKAGLQMGADDRSALAEHMAAQARRAA